MDPIYLGIGARDPNHANSVIPVQTLVAQPSKTYQIFPKPIFYVCYGNEEKPGLRTDVNAFKITVLCVDFSEATVPEAGLTLDTNGDYKADDTVLENGVKFKVSTA